MSVWPGGLRVRLFYGRTTDGPCVLFWNSGSNQPPRFLNYFFSTYLLIYEDMPVGEFNVFSVFQKMPTCAAASFCHLSINRQQYHRRRTRERNACLCECAMRRTHLAYFETSYSGVTAWYRCNIFICPIPPILPCLIYFLLFVLDVMIDRAIWWSLAFHHLSRCRWLGIKLLYIGLIS